MSLSPSFISLKIKSTLFCPTMKFMILFLTRLLSTPHTCCTWVSPCHCLHCFFLWNLLVELLLILQSQAEMFSEADILAPCLCSQSAYSDLMSSTLLLSKDTCLFHLPECSPPPAVVRLSFHSSRNRIKASGCGRSVSWTLLFLFLQNKPCHSPSGNLGNVENPGDRNRCWTSWYYWIKSSHNKPRSAFCLQDKWPNAVGSLITSSSNWMSRTLLLKTQCLGSPCPALT